MYCDGLFSYRYCTAQCGTRTNSNEARYATILIQEVKYSTFSIFTIYFAYLLPVVCAAYEPPRDPVKNKHFDLIYTMRRRIADPVHFLTPDLGSGMNIQDRFSNSLKTVFGILKFFDADPHPE